MKKKASQQMGKHVKSFVTEVKKNRALFVMAMPAFLLVLIMQYLPMSGLVLAFKNYRYDLGVFGSEWNGFANFEYLFSSGTGWLITKNTVVYNLLNLVTSQLIAVLIAIFISEINKKVFKKVTQSIIFLPYFISWVIASNIFLTFLSGDGLINKILLALHVTDEPILFFQKGPYFWWIIALANTWKNMGYNAIIYLAAISGIDAELYEAAEVDGANRLQRIWHITLPALRPQIGILLILAIGGILNTGFEQQLLMGNNAILNYSDVLDTYAYRYGMKNGMYSYGTAVGLFKSAVSFILVLAANKITAKLNDSALF